MTHNRTSLTTADRKRLLIMQGEAFRDGIAQAASHAQESLRPKALVSDVWRHLKSRTGSLWGGTTNGALGGLDIAALMPVVVSGAQLLGKQLWKRSLLKPVLGGVIVLGVAGVTAVCLARRRAQKTAMNAPGESESFPQE